MCSEIVILLARCGAIGVALPVCIFVKFISLWEQ